jgi:cytochrome c peroxidase
MKFGEIFIRIFCAKHPFSDIIGKGKCDKADEERMGKRKGGWKKGYSILMLIIIGGRCDVIEPLPVTISYNHAKAQLGKKLFFDPMLSADGSVSCANCHNSENGADSQPVSTGIAGRKGKANSPTVFNSYFNFRQMWNGTAADLTEQVSMPVHNPIEMAMDDKKITLYLRKNTEYASRFRKIYGSEATFSDMSDAIAEFEKALITPNSRFDRYLKGEKTLNRKEIEGYLLFKELGCITCHNGINIGGNSFQKIGLINQYDWKKQNPDRYSVTHRQTDKNVYKVPSLRNVAITAPYFHDGSVSSLEKALKIMAYHNLGFDLTDEEISKVSAFLKTLTGEKPAILQDGK